MDGTHNLKLQPLLPLKYRKVFIPPPSNQRTENFDWRPQAGHKNRATKTIQKPFTSPWQLILFAQKTHQNQRFSAARARSSSPWLPNLSESAIAPENAEIAIPRCRPLPPKSMLDCIIACPPRCCHGPDTTSQH